MHVLVTGGAGFIGSHLTRRLLARGDRVTVLDDFNDFYDPARKRRNVAPLRWATGVTAWSRATSATQALVDRLFAEGRFDAVIHLAARAGVRPSLERAHPLRGRQLHRHPAPARGGAPARTAELRLRLVLVGLRHQREGAVRRGRRGRPADQPLRHHQAGRRAALLQLPPPLRPAHRLPALLHRLRPGAAARDGDPQVHRPARPRRDRAALRRRRDAAATTPTSTTSSTASCAALDLAPGFEIFNLGGAETTRSPIWSTGSPRSLASSRASSIFQPEQPGDVPDHLRRRLQGRRDARLLAQGADPRGTASVSSPGIAQQRGPSQEPDTRRGNR